MHLPPLKGQKKPHYWSFSSCSDVYWLW